MGKLHRDVISGLMLFAAGGVFTLYIVSEYSIGTLQRFGPGMFPMALGCIMAVLGLLIAASALIKPETFSWASVSPRSIIATLASVAVFAFTLRTTGMIPAVILTTLVATQAEKKVSLPVALVFSAIFALITALIFGIGLGMPIPLFRWPF